MSCLIPNVKSCWSNGRMNRIRACGVYPSDLPKWERPLRKQQCENYERKRALKQRLFACLTPIPMTVISTATCSSSPLNWRKLQEQKRQVMMRRRLRTSRSISYPPSHLAPMKKHCVSVLKYTRMSGLYRIHISAYRKSSAANCFRIFW